jgi:hypothetical protein
LNWRIKGGGRGERINWTALSRREPCIKGIALWMGFLLIMLSNYLSIIAIHSAD